MTALAPWPGWRPSHFAELLFGAQPPGYVQLWSLEDRRSTYLRSPVGADVVANGRPNVFVGVGLATRDLGRTRRAKADEVVAIAGLWLDLDVNGGPDGKVGAAPSREVASDLVYEAAAVPTVLIDSGHGLHGWWLLHEPWLFASTEERDQAALASAQWQELHRRAAGFRVDYTHDLSRVLRLPGTANGKRGDHRPVRVIGSFGPGYEREQLIELAAQAGPVRVRGGGPTGVLSNVEVGPGRCLPDELIESLCARSAEFAASWRHDRPDRPYWSLSEYDLALCASAAKARWTDQQLADLIAHHRRRYGGIEKASRADYIARTIAKARAYGSQQARAAVRAEARVGTVRDSRPADQRGDGLGRLAEHLLAKNVDARLVREVAQIANGRTRAPLPDDEVDRVVAQVCTRELRRRGGHG